MENNVILKVQNLSKEFDVKGKGLFGKKEKLKAVQDISLEIQEGEILGIVGESGCGKSTLGRLIMRLIEPTNGHVILKNEELTGLKESDLRKKRKDFQMIFQDPYAAFDPRMNIQQILEEPLKTYDIPKDTWDGLIQKMLKLTGIPEDALKRYPHEFSGGQRQRISIARALILNPKLIVADEPVSALDVSIQAQILNLMKDLQNEFKLTMVFISHNLASVQYISNRIAVMYLGRIVEVASSDALYDQPLHPYTQALISAIPIPVPGDRKKKDRLKGEVPSPINLPQGCAFHLRCPHATEACKQTIPPLTEVAPGHLVACHKYQNKETIDEI